MTTIKFTADVEGNSPDELEQKARAAANDFFRDLPDVPQFKGANVSFDPDYYAQRVEASLKEAQEKAKAWNDEHPDEEPAEAVPADVPKYTGWFEFEYEVKQTRPKRTVNEVWAEQNAASGSVPEYTGDPANDPKYQAAFE